MTDESFKDHPRSIGEIRSERSQLARDWTPREALVAMLRDIDAGVVKNVDALIVCFRYQHGGAMKTSFVAATPDGLTTLGLLERTKFRIHEVAT